MRFVRLIISRTNASVKTTCDAIPHEASLHDQKHIGAGANRRAPILGHICELISES
jgi:hypothetical protein